MKTLTQYINEEAINEDLINEGFWAKLGSALGFSSAKVTKSIKGWKDDVKRGFSVGQYYAVKSKDKSIKDAAKKEAEGAAQSPEKALQAVKDECTRLAKNIKKDNLYGNNIYITEYILSQYNLLRDLSNDLNDEDGKKMAKSFKAIIDEKFPDDLNKSEKNIEEIGKKIDNVTNQSSSKESEQSSDKSSDSSSLGLTDGNEQQATTVKQETNAVTDEIKDSNAFFKPLAEAAGIDGETLRESIVNLINTSLKRNVAKKNEKPVYKWNTDTKGFQTKNEDKLIKGLGALLCGLMMINHKGMNEAITDKLIDFGFKKTDYLEHLTKQ